MSAMKALPAGPVEAAPMPSHRRNSRNHQAFVVVTNRKVASEYMNMPLTTTGLRPIRSLRRPSGDENRKVPA